MLYPSGTEEGRSGRLREICGGWGSRLKWFQSKLLVVLRGGATLVKRLAVRDGCGDADEGFSGGGEHEREEELLWVVTVKETDMREMEGKKLMAGEGNCSPETGQWGRRKWRCWRLEERKR
ncbi:hypothetical protein OIU74_007286 [Salix koriyanagi]|uniref:Uncharacterized protein n=1 Tax=Salix koriyanagi TaxID=2511006 RepID=A0A9Q0U3E8_9ROSI|nr:hypothetical protein OIU74_007286 [Salix koriyanagi]